MDLLLQGEMEKVGVLTKERPGLLRHLLGRLWDEAPEIRHRAAAALGRAAEQHPQQGLELMRRFAWALNDESATNGLHVIPAMAEIAVRAPGVAEPFLGMLVNALHDPGLRAEAVSALELIDEHRPELLEEYREEIRVAVET